MNEEEKEAIELLKQEPDFSLSYYKRERAIDIVLNYIEKLQKQNREYEYTIAGMVQTREDNFIPKYKIREIVEKSYNDIDYFNRDIRKDIEDLLGE